MPEKSPETASSSGSGERMLAALVALIAADRDERADQVPARRSETVLGEAGFSYQEVAGFTGKNPEAVRSAVRRTKKTSSAKEPKK